MTIAVGTQRKEPLGASQMESWGCGRGFINSIFPRQAPSKVNQPGAEIAGVHRDRANNVKLADIRSALESEVARLVGEEEYVIHARV